MSSHLELQNQITDVVAKYILKGFTSSNANAMLQECAPILVQLKESLGKENETYLSTSTYVAGIALKMIIKNVNEIPRNKGLYVVKNAIIDALRAMKNVEIMNLERDFFSDVFLPNQNALHKIATQLGLVASSVMASIDLRTDDEFFAACRDVLDYEDYISTFPNGKHIESANNFVRAAERKKKISKRIKIILILAVIMGITGAILYAIFTRDTRKFESVPKTEAGYTEYLNEFPNGKHTDEALSALYDIANRQGLTPLLEFGKKYSSTKHGERAVEYVRNFADSLYNIASTENTLSAWDKFIAAIPYELQRDAISKKNAIYLELYNEANKKNTIAAWEDYMSKVPASQHRDAQERIETLTWKSESSAWKKAQSINTISIYEKYLSHHPNGAHAATARKKIIDLKVDAIGAGDHGTLPSMDKVSWGSGSSSTISVENDTQYTLTLMYSGKSQSKEIKISPNGKKTFTMPNGEYRIAATVNASNVRGFYGRETLTGGSYSASYYISTTRF